MSETCFVDLFVLVHGIQGPFGDSARDLGFIREEILKKFESKENLYLVPICEYNQN